MSDPAAVEEATRRLTRALDMLDAAIENRLEGDRSRAGLAEQMHTLDADRSRLAAELDAQLGRVRSLEAINRDIAGRLDAAMESVRQVLEAQD